MEPGPAAGVVPSPATEAVHGPADVVPVVLAGDVVGSVAGAAIVP
jgi:hypothetical protein